MNRLKTLAGFVLSGTPAEPANAAPRGGRRPTSLNINPPPNATAEHGGQAADDNADDDDDDMDAVSASRDDSAAGEASDRGQDEAAEEGGNDDADDADVGNLQEEEEEEEEEVVQEEQEEDQDDGKKKKQQKRRRRRVVSSSEAAGSDDDDGGSDDGGPARKLRRNAPRKSRDSTTAAVAATASKSTEKRTRRPRNKATTSTTGSKKATKATRRREEVVVDVGEEIDELEDEQEEVGAEEEEEEEEEEGDAVDDSAHSSSDDELVQLTEAEIADLENPELVSHFTKLRNGDVDRGPLGVGDVVKLRPSGGSDSWLAVIERISAKKEEVKLGEGDNRHESNFVGIQLSWLYARTDFENVHPSNPAWKGPCKVMGPNERVKTDHTDWNHQSMVLSKDPELVYVFDDSYPGIPPNDTQPSKHPLSLFSIDALHPLAPSIYSWPALEALSRRSRTIAPITAQRKIPSYFFGVSALPTIDPLLPEEETSGKPKKLNDGKDGVAGIPYVRVGFAFKPLPKITNGGLGDEEEEGGEEATPDEGSSPKKKKKGGKGRRKSTAKDSARKVWPLKFAEHSFSNQPYNPRNVQHYSRARGTWYDVSDLGELLRYYSNFPEEYREYEAAREKPDDQQPAFSLDLDAPTFDPSVARITTLVEKLGHLADDKIVRGGAYGLTGNAYLVIQAGELHERLTDSAAAPPMEYDADDVDAARAILADAVAWREEVSRRVKGVQEGRRLAKEWRSLGDEDLPYGHEWLCPESGEPI
ncbi:hypothetical protein JCM8115_003446 [Rhodotorula mucilaginosa]